MTAPTSEAPSSAAVARTGLLGFVLDIHNRTILFRVGNWILVTYGLLAGLAFFVGHSAALWFDGMSGQSVHEKAQFYLFFLLPAMLMGARAFSVLLEWRELFRKPLQTLVKPGYMLHGGVFGGLAAMVAYATMSDQSLLRIMDAGAFAVPLGEALCRIGCYVYGCCWGRPSTGPFGVRYTSPHAKVVRCAPHLHGVRLHPTQVYGLVAHLAQFTVFYAILPFKAFDGMIAGLYLVTHPMIRFTLERFRQDDRGKLFGPFTHTNLYSIVMIALGALCLLIGSQSGMNAPINMQYRWIHVVTDPSLLLWLSLVMIVVVLAFGVHYRSVGSWMNRPSGGLYANIDELSMGASERLDAIMHGHPLEHEHEHER